MPGITILIYYIGSFTPWVRQEEISSNPTNTRREVKNRGKRSNGSSCLFDLMTNSQNLNQKKYLIDREEN